MDGHRFVPSPFREREPGRVSIRPWLSPHPKISPCEGFILPDFQVNLYLFSGKMKNMKNKFKLLVIDDHPESPAGLK